MIEISQKIDRQNSHRQEWTSHDTPEILESMVLEELQELTDAIDSFFVIENPDFEIASEIGDVGYLCLRYESECGELTPSIMNAMLFAQETAEIVGLDFVSCIEMKLLRNAVKYPDYLEGEVHKSKSLWKQLGGDKQFYIWYMYHIDNEY